MEIHINYQMRATIQADTIEEAQSIWESTNLELNRKNIQTEFVDTIRIEDEYGHEVEFEY